MTTRPAKKLKRQMSGNKGDETERVLSKHKEDLHDKMMGFLDSLPQVIARFTEYSNTVSKENPNRGQGTSPIDTISFPADGCNAAKDLPQPLLNTTLLSHLSTLKTEAYGLNKQVLSIAEWITLMIPQIKDEDNAGVEVQMQVHGELVGLAKEIDSKYDLEWEYLEARASLESKYYKHFQAPSWIRCIQRMDANRWDDLEIAWRELIRILLCAYALLTNNMEKLKNPRSTHAHTSYMTM